MINLLDDLYNINLSNYQKILKMTLHKEMQQPTVHLNTTKFPNPPSIDHAKSDDPTNCERKQCGFGTVGNKNHYSIDNMDIDLL